MRTTAESTAGPATSRRLPVTAACPVMTRRILRAPARRAADPMKSSDLESICPLIISQIPHSPMPSTTVRQPESFPDRTFDVRTTDDLRHLSECQHIQRYV